MLGRFTSKNCYISTYLTDYLKNYINSSKNKHKSEKYTVNLRSNKVIYTLIPESTHKVGTEKFDIIFSFYPL